MTKCKFGQILGTKQYFWSCGFFWFFEPLVIFIYLFGPLDSVYCTSLIVTSKQYHFDFLGLSKAERLGSFYIKMKNCFLTLC